MIAFAVHHFKPKTVNSYIPLIMKLHSRRLPLPSCYTVDGNICERDSYPEYVR